MRVVACLLLFGGLWGGTLLLRRRLAKRRPVRRSRDQVVGGVLIGVAFASLFVGVLVTDPPDWLPYVAWSVAGIGAGLISNPSRSVVPGT
ncbi:MAG: hypothetical protein M3353_02775 [Actinomycetota bacterium]|nr:hypothetical protein [Actinomycetota bacterium]